MSETGSVSGAASGPKIRKRRAGKNRALAGEKPVPQGVLKRGSNRWMEQVYMEKPAFPEELFETIFTIEKIQTLVAALKLATEKEVEESKRLLESDYTYSLMICSHKIPHVAVHLTRVALKHSMLDEDTEIALFVKDLKRGRRLDSEPTIQHYEQLLREKGVTKFRITVIPMNQLYNEYATFELRRKLSYLYDKFLADASIAAHVNGFLGTKMLQKGRLAMPVNLKKDDLNVEFDRALRQVFYKHANQGITQSIQIGKHHMTDDQIAENVIDLLSRIGDIHPGGYKNIYKLFLRPQTNVSVSIPIFAATAKCTEDTPTELSAKEKVLNGHSKTSKQLLEDFDITAAGKFVHKRRSTGFILDEELLLSENELEPAAKKPFVPPIKDDATEPTPSASSQSLDKSSEQLPVKGPNNRINRKKEPQQNHNQQQQQPLPKQQQRFQQNNHNRNNQSNQFQGNGQTVSELNSGDFCSSNNRNDGFDRNNRNDDAPNFAQFDNGREFGDEFSRRPNWGGGSNNRPNNDRGFGRRF